MIKRFIGAILILAISFSSILSIHAGAPSEEPWSSPIYPHEANVESGAPLFPILPRGGVGEFPF